MLFYIIAVLNSFGFVMHLVAAVNATHLIQSLRQIFHLLGAKTERTDAGQQPPGIVCK